jgi:hypothetical protein
MSRELKLVSTGAYSQTMWRFSWDFRRHTAASLTTAISQAEALVTFAVDGVLEELLNGEAMLSGGSLAPAATSSDAAEVKFHTNLEDDEQRWILAISRREKLSKSLGLPAENLAITDVKPGSPLTTIRSQSKQPDATACGNIVLALAVHSLPINGVWNEARDETLRGEAGMEGDLCDSMLRMDVTVESDPFKVLAPGGGSRTAAHFSPANLTHPTGGDEGRLLRETGVAGDWCDGRLSIGADSEMVSRVLRHRDDLNATTRFVGNQSAAVQLPITGVRDETLRGEAGMEGDL